VIRGRPALAASLAGLLLSCRPAPPPPAAPPRAAPRPSVSIESPSGRSIAVEVELARTPEEQERGLMFRERLGPASGMLFVFGDTSEHVFWMKNTLIPLDMIFIDEAEEVVGVVERAEPLTLVPRTAGVPSRYVLEVAGGFAAEHGVRKGDRARLHGVR
jgi:hypothetical protein